MSKTKNKLVKGIIGTIAALALALGVSLVMPQSAQAEEFACSTYNDCSSIFTEYTTVVDNQYVMDIPASANIPEDIVDFEQGRLAEWNKLLANGSWTIDPTTGEAQRTVLDRTRSYGDSYTKCHDSCKWLEVHLNADQVNKILDHNFSILNAFFGAGIGFANDMAGLIYGLITSQFGSPLHVSNGVWVNYNYNVGCYAMPETCYFSSYYIQSWGWQ
jgi:hypothetical protein